MKTLNRILLVFAVTCLLGMLQGCGGDPTIITIGMVKPLDSTQTGGELDGVVTDPNATGIVEGEETLPTNPGEVRIVLNCTPDKAGNCEVTIVQDIPKDSTQTGGEKKLGVVKLEQGMVTRPIVFKFVPMNQLK